MSIEIQGADELLAKFSKMEDGATIRKGMQQACVLVETSAKETAPIDSGALRRSIASRIEDGGATIEGIVYTPLEYAPYVEYGTGLFAEGGNGRKTPWAYRDDEGKLHFTHGQHPHPYMRPALSDNRSQITQLLGEGITND